MVVPECDGCLHSAVATVTERLGCGYSHDIFLAISPTIRPPWLDQLSASLRTEPSSEAGESGAPGPCNSHITYL